MFAGDEHHRVRDELLHAFDEVTKDGMPATVVLSGAPGWGKTRVIQEFYRALAATQAEPAYWPSELESDDSAALDADSISKRRKRVRLPPFTVAGGARLEWIWLAPAGQQVGGVPLSIVDDLQAQVAPHIAPILMRIERRKSRVRAVTRFVRAVAPLPDFVGVVESLRDLGGDAHDIGETVAQELEHLRRHGRGRTIATSEYGFSRLDPLIRTFEALFASPVGSDWQERRTPVILILDDAHLLDEISVALLRRLMAMELPLLVLCTTWPEEIDEPERSAFAAYLHDARDGPSQMSVIDVPAMTEQTLVELVLERFPHTDRAIAHALAQKADGNPYQLLLMLASGRIERSVRDGGITLDVDQVHELPSTIASWLRVHWDALSKPVRRLLAATATLEERFAIDVASASLAGIADGMLAPESCSYWINVVDAEHAISEFLERPRFELARDAQGESLDPEEVAKVATQALTAIHELLESGPSVFTRRVVLAMHLSLAGRGYELDFGAAARSGMEIARGLRTEKLFPNGRETMERAARWAEAADPRDPELVVRALIETAALTRLSLNRSRAEPRARRAYDLAVASLPVHHEARLAAAIELARSLRRRRPASALIEARALLAAVDATIEALPNPSTEISRDVQAFRISLLGYDGGAWQAAAESCEALLATCDAAYGRLHDFSLEASDELGFYRRRAGDITGAIEARREALARRTELSGSTDSVQLAGVKTDLAVTLSDLGTADALAEAAQLTDEALRAREAAYGRLNKMTLNVVSARSKIHFERGKLEELIDPRSARVRYEQALVDAERLVQGRDALGLGELTNGLALLRRGAAEAGLMDPTGYDTLIRARTNYRLAGNPENGLYAKEIERTIAWAADRLGVAKDAG